MKKSLPFLVFSFYFLLSSPLSAEVPDDKKVTGGIGINATALRFGNNISFIDSRFQAGAELIGFLHIPVSQRFSFQCGLSWGFDRTSISNSMIGTAVGSTLEDMHVAVPFYFIYRRPLASSVLLFGLGPYTNFVVRARHTMADGTAGENPYTQQVQYDPVTGETHFALNSNNSGLGCLLGFETSHGLQVTASFSMSIANILGFDYGDNRVHPQKLTLGLAYRFGARK